MWHENCCPPGINGRGGAFFRLFDQANRYTVMFGDSFVGLLGSSGFIDISLDVSQFHTNRMESQANTGAYDIYIDGVLSYSGLAPTYVASYNGLNFGDGLTDPGNGADVNWDYLRLSQPIAETAVPEPASLPLLLLPAAVLWGVRRRRYRV